MALREIFLKLVNIYKIVSTNVDIASLEHLPSRFKAGNLLSETYIMKKSIAAITAMLVLLAFSSAYADDAKAPVKHVHKHHAKKAAAAPAAK